VLVHKQFYLLPSS